MLWAVLHVVVLAGGGDAADNHHSHLVHVRGAVSVLAEAGVPSERVHVFWADGDDSGPDRAVVREPPVAGAWMLAGTPLDRLTQPGPELVDTRFPYAVQPATREALSGWIERNGPQLGPGDTLLFAVTDHGEPGLEGDTSVTLWGESWSASQFEADLTPVPESVRVVLWMSQCHSGGFMRVARNRRRTCGAFSAEADRVAYGCFPDLAGRPDVGHFAHLLTGLARGGVLTTAHDEALLTDDTPDTPHLSSDEHLFAAYEQASEAGVGPQVDAGLARVAPDTPERRLAARIAARYGLGVVPDYSAVLEILESLRRTRHALTAWQGATGAALDELRDRLTRELARKLGQPKGRAARRRARARAVARIDRRLKRRPGLRRRLGALARADARAGGLLDRLELQEAAALRVARLYERLAAPAVLGDTVMRRYAELRACEEAPLWTPPPAPDPEAFVGPPYEPAPMVPVTRLAAEVEALRPGYFGVTYRDARRGGVEVTAVMPGGPAAAAGLRSGDVVSAIDGWKLERGADLPLVAASSAPGARLRLSVHGQADELTLVAAPKPLPLMPLVTGELVPALRLVPHRGVELPRVADGRRTLLFFWATTCGPCKRALPALEAYAREEGVAVIAVTGEDEATVQSFLKTASFPFPIARDPTRTAMDLFAVDRTPTFAVIDERGRFASYGVGFEGALPVR